MKGIINFGLLGIRRVFGGVMPPKPSIDKWVREHLVFWYDMAKPVDVYIPGVTYANPFVNLGGKITYDMPTGTWDVYPFLCTAILEQDASDVANDCYSIPLLSSKSIEIISSYVSITVLAGLLPSIAGNTTVTIRVRNSSSGTITFRNNAWRTRFINKDFKDPLVMGEQYGSIADFDVPAGTTKEMEVTVSVSSQLVQAKNAKLWISLNSASYIGSSIFMVAPDQ